MNTPPINVKNLDLQAVDLLQEFQGKNLLIVFYNNDCLGCTGRALPLAYEMKQEFKDLEVLGIHSNFNRSVTKEEILEIFTSKELPFPIYIDENHKVYDAYQCEGTPHWIIINSEGSLFRSFFGSQNNSQTRMWYALNELMENHSSNSSKH